MSLTTDLPLKGPVSPADLALAQRQSGWTPLRVSVALRHWNAGMSDAEIAGLIGGGVSRNAVIGMRYRNDHVVRIKVRRPQPGAASQPRVAPKATPPRMAPVSAPRPPDIRDAEIPMAQRLTLVQLSPVCCHWPVGDPGRPDFFFCGAVVPRRDDQKFDPYYVAHMQRARRPAPARLAVHRDGPDRRPNF